MGKKKNKALTIQTMTLVYIFCNYMEEKKIKETS